MKPAPIAVFANNLQAGTLRLSSWYTATFRYADEWLSNDKRFPVSLTMPCSDETYGHKKVSAWLAGLMPDNPKVILRWHQNQEAPSATPLGLLSTKIGHDCAGAIQFCVAGKEDELLERNSGIAELSRNDLETEISKMVEDSSRWTPPGVHYYSLAGFQTKTALRKQSTKWGRPYGNEPSTHILKPSPKEAPSFAVMEHLCLETASNLGLEAARSEVQEFAGHPVLIVERYDREGDGGSYRRVHQEDFCQAMGVPPELKYERMGGGASLMNCGDMLYETTTNARHQVSKFCDALLYVWMTVNTDAHAKNYSIIITPEERTLAPLYDLSTALTYHGDRIGELRYAMRFGTNLTVEAASSERMLSDLAVKLELSEETTIARAEEMIVAFHDAFNAAFNRLSAHFQSMPYIDSLPERLDTRMKNCLQTVELGKREVAARRAKHKALLRKSSDPSS